MERISLRDKVSIDVLTGVKEDKCMINTGWQRKHKWLGHVPHHEVLLRDIRDGRMNSRATRGRKRLDMLSDFWTTTGYVEVKRAAEGRGLWSAKR